jgi:hypothetical protein
MMINLSKWAGICVVVISVFALTNAATAAQDDKVFLGTLVSADANAKVLTLKEGDKEMQFTYTELTELVGPQKDGQPVAVRQGSRLRIHYKELDKTNVATKVEVVEV